MAVAPMLALRHARSEHLRLSTALRPRPLNRMRAHVWTALPEGDYGDIVRLLLRQFAKPVLWANLIAWPVTAYVMNRWLQGFAYHVNLDVWLFPAAAALALVIALATVSTQSIRVARAKPVVALRYE